MNHSPQDIILSYIEESIIDTDCFLVSFKVKPTHNYKIYMDSDSGFSLDKSIKINRFIRKKIEESGMFPNGDFSLEVSSPGIDNPLTMLRQYRKNLGRTIEIEFLDPEKKGIKGELIKVEDEQISIQPTAPKKIKKDSPNESITVSFSEIKKAQICIQF